MKKILFIDRDGTLILEPEDKQIDSFEKLEFYPKVIGNLRRIITELDFEPVMVSNQDGLGTTSFPENTFWPVQNKMLTILKNEGIEFSDILIDRSLPEDNAPTRKPGTAMLKKYLEGDYDLGNSWVIGDRESDIQLAKNLGAKSIILGNVIKQDADKTTMDWDDIYNFLKFPDRTAVVKRKTNETDISLEINLDKPLGSRIETGLGFFDHMLSQIAQTSACQFNISCKGDLEVDEHHTIEDTALALGEAFSMALGEKRSIERYGFLLPMDEALTHIALDFSGRSWLVWDLNFKREKIGDVPTELFYHFFKSFTDSAKCTLHISAKGDNEHHLIESVFKALGKVIKQAVSRNGNHNIIPSSKGVL